MTVYLAAMLALGNEMTVGMIFAFMAYKMNFTEKACDAGREGCSTSACSTCISSGSPTLRSTRSSRVTIVR